MNEKSRDILARNLKLLCDVRGLDSARLAERSGKAQRSVNGWERAEKAANLDSIDELARALRVPPWILMLPTLAEIARDTERLSALIDLFSTLPKPAREQVLRVAEAEARYSRHAA